jgi:hypothetical protein
MSSSAGERLDKRFSELEIAVFPGRIEITERPDDLKAEQLIAELRELGVDCKLVFKAPCG